MGQNEELEKSTVVFMSKSVNAVWYDLWQRHHPNTTQRVDELGKDHWKTNKVDKETYSEIH